MKSRMIHTLPCPSPLLTVPALKRFDGACGGVRMINSLKFVAKCSFTSCFLSLALWDGRDIVVDIFSFNAALLYYKNFNWWVQGLFIVYPAYPAGVFFQRRPQMFRSPFGDTQLFLNVSRPLFSFWAWNVSWPYIFWKIIPKCFVAPNERTIHYIGVSEK